MKHIDGLVLNPTAKNQISIEELEMLSEIKDRLEYIIAKLREPKR